MADEKKLSPLEVVEAKRAARKEAAQKALEAQLAIDLAEIDEIEARLGDSSVAVIRLPYSAGLPAAVAVRTPTTAEAKRWRDRVRPSKDSRNREVAPDAGAAAEELGATCRVYPTDEEVFETLCAVRPGIRIQMGTRALELAGGREEAEGKG